VKPAATAGRALAGVAPAHTKPQPSVEPSPTLRQDHDGTGSFLIAEPVGCTEAERGVLGGLLCLPAAGARAVTDTMVFADFTDPRHRGIFEAVTVLVAAGTPADPITVVGYLRRTGQERCFTSDRAPGVFLFDLLDALPSLGNLQYYRRIVVEHAARRRAREASVRVAQTAEQEDLHTARQVTADELQAVLDAFDRTAAT